MKNTILNFFVCILMLQTAQSKAQSETIQFNVGNFRVPKEEKSAAVFKPFVRQFGLSYTHSFSKHWSARLAYTQWYNWNKLNHFIPTYGNGYYNAYVFPYSVGHILSHFDYQFIDVAVRYKTNISSFHHEVYAAAGLSYAWGKYTQATGVFHEPGYPDWIIKSEVYKTSSLGILAELGYNYVFLKQKMSIGINESVKSYSNLPLQLYSSFSIAYRFNWQKK